MAYRFEKNENGTSDLVIDGWENGIGDSAVTGHQQMQNVDIFNYPGFLACQYKSVKKSGSTVTDLIKWFATDPGGNYAIYGVGDTGKVYKSSDSGATWSVVAGNPTTNASANGLAVWHDYLFVARDGNLDVYGPLSGVPGWNPAGWPKSFTVVTADLFHPLYTGAEDDNLYAGDFLYLQRLSQNAGTTFDAANAATYTWTTGTGVLDLPNYFCIRCIEGLNTNLLLGTSYGLNIDRVPVGNIFPWDRASTTYSLPIKMGVNAVSMMKNINNIVYIYAGNMADISKTNGSTTALYKRLRNITIPAGSTIEPLPGAMEGINNNELLIGIGNTGSNSGPFGVYSIEDGIHVLRNTLSTGTTSNVLVGAIQAITRDDFIFSWKDGSTYGIDKVSASNGYWDDWSSSVDADEIPISTFLYPQAFSEIEFKLGKVLATGEGVRVYYRTALTDSFTLVGQWTFADIGARMSYNAPASIVRSQFLQFRVQLLGVAGSSGTTPLLKEIRVR